MQSSKHHISHRVSAPFQELFEVAEREARSCSVIIRVEAHAVRLSHRLIEHDLHLLEPTFPLCCLWKGPLKLITCQALTILGSSLSRSLDLSNHRALLLFTQSQRSDPLPDFRYAV